MLDFTKEELVKYLQDLDLPQPSILFENPDYFTAIIGVDLNTGSVIYDYNKMIEFLMETDDMDRIEAIEFIEYNTVRSIPYFDGGVKPTINYSIEDMILI